MKITFFVIWGSGKQCYESDLIKKKTDSLLNAYPTCASSVYLKKLITAFSKTITRNFFSLISFLRMEFASLITCSYGCRYCFYTPRLSEPLMKVQGTCSMARSMSLASLFLLDVLLPLASSQLASISTCSRLRLFRLNRKHLSKYLHYLSWEGYRLIDGLNL
jgi:hypothetical protein